MLEFTPNFNSRSKTRATVSRKDKTYSYNYRVSSTALSLLRDAEGAPAGVGVMAVGYDQLIVQPIRGQFRQ